MSRITVLLYRQQPLPKKLNSQCSYILLKYSQCCATGGLGLHSNQDGDDVRTN